MENKRSGDKSAEQRDTALSQTLKVIFLDFDGCLMDAPTPETGKEQWAAHHGKDYPYEGWWSKKESLCLDAFQINPFYKLDKVLTEATADPNIRTVLLTNRIGKLENSVKAVLDRQGYVLDMYTFRRGPDNKGQRIQKILENEFPEATEAVFYDDDVRHLRDAKAEISNIKVPLKLFRVDRGEIIPFN